MKYFIYVIKAGITALSENSESQIKMTVRSTNSINSGDRIIGFCENPISEYRYIFNGLSMSNGKITLSKILQILNGVKSNTFLPDVDSKIKKEIVNGNDLVEITENQYKEIEIAILNKINLSLNREPKKANNTNNVEIPFSRNRIVFGAPGTGKSKKLAIEAEERFPDECTENLKKKLYEEIHSQPSDADQAEWITSLGIRYAKFINEEYISPKRQNSLITDFDLLNEGEPTTKKKEQLVQGSKAAYRLNLVFQQENNSARVERVTFHPNYSYSQFVGTYKPITINKSNSSNITKEQEVIINILKDKTKTGQEKYDLLYEHFKQDNLTRLPLLLGIFTDDEFKTRKVDGSSAANDNGVERNHGRAIRPFLNITENSLNNEITYEYVPGPFIRTFIKAKKTGQNVLLLIEEINRANVAAVFGDMFQLLDRDADGNSEYPITTSEDLRNFLAKPENLGGKPEDYTKIQIPKNMYIWATMNSADQGVLPMDAAFKRRWDFEYINIDDGENELDGVTIPIPNGINADNTINYVDIEWNALRKEINKQLKTVSGVNEDKLLGPFFIGDKTKITNAIQDKEQFCKSFKSKVLMYLFEDVVKMQPGELFESMEGTNVHYSDIYDNFDKKGLRVFVKAIYEKFPAFVNGESE